MNRERNASGINSYEKEFKFKPEEFLATKISESGKASWLDLCCGVGNALIQTANYFDKRGQQNLVKLKGIDLINTFSPIEKHLTCLDFKTRSLTDWESGVAYDMITCVHGLHYLGDKLKVIEAIIKALNPDGLFIANLDISNIVIQGTNSRDFLKKYFKQNGLIYKARLRIIKRIGPANLNFPVRYLGADDECGPNYTGQDSVTSYYSI